MSAGLFPQSADSKRMINKTQSFSYQKLVCFLLLGLLGFKKKNECERENRYQNGNSKCSASQKLKIQHSAHRQ